MTGDNLAKREEARRVWRLNKKESVPVLEALETANISKDTYYEYKREYESDWEDQLLSAQDVEQRLEELSDEIRDLLDQAETVEGRLDRAEDMTDAVAEVEDALAAADQAERQAYRAEQSVRHIESELGVSIDPESGEVETTLADVAEQQQQITSHLSELTERVDDLEDELASEQRRRQDTHARMNDEIEAAKEGGGLLSGLFGG